MFAAASNQVDVEGFGATWCVDSTASSDGTFQPSSLKWSHKVLRAVEARAWPAGLRADARSRIPGVQHSHGRRLF